MLRIIMKIIYVIYLDNTRGLLWRLYNAKQKGTTFKEKESGAHNKGKIYIQWKEDHCYVSAEVPRLFYNTMLK